MFVYNKNIFSRLREGDIMYDYHLCEDRDILCIDQKSFFASVSCIMKGLDPLTTKLAVIADTKRQGSIVLAATEPLKKLGVKTGSRLFEIPHRNDIYIINPSMKRYLEYSVAITKISLRYVAPEDFHQYSIDEFFIDITDSYKQFSSTPRAFAQRLMREIKEETQIQCAIGIGSNMLLSKVSLDMESKTNEDFIAEWRYQDVPTKLWPINPLSKFWGINHRTEKKLNAKGIFTIGDLAHYPQQYLKREYGVIGTDLHLHANGIDLSKIKEKHRIMNPTICKSQILMRDYYYHETKVVLLELVEEVAMRLRSRDLLVKTISFSMGYSGEGGVNKQYTLKDGTNLTMDIFRVIWSFAEQLCDKQAKYRTLSVTLNNFVPERARQLNLFIDEFERQRDEALEKTIDKLKRKYGPNVVSRAVSYTPAATARERAGLIAGHKK